MNINIQYLRNSPICVAKTATHGLRKDECCITTDIQPLLYKSENTGSPDKRMSSRNVIQHFYSAKFLYLKATDYFFVLDFIIGIDLNLPAVSDAWRVEE